MRIADKMKFEQVNSTLGKNRENLFNLQTQSATQKRVNKPSDDGLAAARLVSYRDEKEGISQFLKTIQFAQSNLDMSDQSLEELTNLLVRGKELVMGQVNDASSSAQTRRTVAVEIDQLLSQAIQIGNRRMGNRYIFGGYRITAPPFDSYGKYMGDDGQVMLAVNKDSQVAINVPGSMVFLGHGISKDGIAQDASSSLESIEEIHEFQEQQHDLPTDEFAVPLENRGLASIEESGKRKEMNLPSQPTGLNIFEVFETISIGLKSNDKQVLQESLIDLDDATSQVVLARAQIGARQSTITHLVDSLSKASIDAQASISQLEDADAFKVLSDLNQSETTLKSTLAVSAKLIQPSLLDFLR